MVLALADIPFMTPLRMTRKTSRRHQTWYPLADTFQFPPTPPETGVNVFGAVRNIRIDDATGSLTIGPTRSLSLNAPTPVDFRKISGRGIIGNRFLIPVRVDAYNADLELQGRALTYINDVPVSRTRSKLLALLSSSTITLIAAVAAACFAGAALRDARTRRLAGT